MKINCIIIIIVILIYKCIIYCDTLILINTFGDFKNAVSITTARQEYIFVSDITTNQIYKYNSAGDLITSFGGTGFGNSELSQPYSVYASNGLDVLIADYNNNQIKRLDINLNFIQLIDFNYYNLQLNTSDKIYHPAGVCILSTGELFTIIDSDIYKIAKINNYNDVSLLFGTNNLGEDRVVKPVKIIPGNKIDIWILDVERNEILNFNNMGIFIKKIKLLVNNENIININIFYDDLYILTGKSIIVYNLNRNIYEKTYIHYVNKNIRDLALLNQDMIVLLTKNHIYKLKIK